MNQVAQKVEVLPEQRPSTALTPMDMINQAVASGANVETLGKLMELQERWDRNQARKAFDEAVAAAKAEIPPVGRNATGHNSKRYADFAAIARVVDPIITKHGLGYRFSTAQDELINVTCVLFHKAGHSEQTTLSGPSDTTGNKNAIQAIGSTLTYLQRYSLVQMLGLAAGDDDDGASQDAGDTISPEQLTELQATIAANSATDPKLKDAFLKHMRVESLAAIPAARFEDAKAALVNRKATIDKKAGTK